MKDGIQGNNVKKSASGMVNVLLLLLFVCAPLTTFAVSYPVQLYHRQDRHDKFAKGETAYLFHSGIDEVKKTIHVNSILPVYRISPACKLNETGKIRIISYVGETYLKAEIIEGEIKPDDIAKKGKVSCILISAGVCEH